MNRPDIFLSVVCLGPERHCFFMILPWNYPTDSRSVSFIVGKQERNGKSYINVYSESDLSSGRSVGSAVLPFVSWYSDLFLSVRSFLLNHWKKWSDDLHSYPVIHLIFQPKADVPHPPISHDNPLTKIVFPTDYLTKNQFAVNVYVRFPISFLLPHNECTENRWCLRDGVWCYFNKIIVTVKWNHKMIQCSKSLYNK